MLDNAVQFERLQQIKTESHCRLTITPYRNVSSILGYLISALFAGHGGWWPWTIAPAAEANLGHTVKMPCG